MSGLEFCGESMSDLRIKLRKQMVETIHEYGMIEQGDRVMVAVSGGKDSSVLLRLLADAQTKAPISFEIAPVILDQKQPGFDVSKYQAWVEAEVGMKLTVIEEDTYSIVKEKVAPGKTTCGLCSRLRRGILYNYASAHGFNKIALGHHREDLNQTLLLNLFFTGTLASMPPKLFSDDGRNIVIRPLAGCGEEDIASFAEQLSVPTIPCNLCGSQENLQRKRMKKLLADLRKEIPAIDQSLLKAQSNVRLSQLADTDVFDFLRMRDEQSSQSNLGVGESHQPVV